MAHATPLRPQQRPHRTRQEERHENWQGEETRDTDDNFDTALHLASHAHRLKNIDLSLDHFDQSLKNFQTIYLEERKRQNILMGVMAVGIVASMIAGAFWAKNAGTPQIVTAPKPAHEAQLLPPQQPTIQQPMINPTPALQAAQQSTQQPIIQPVMQPQMQSGQPPYAAQPQNGSRQIVALGARYDQMQRPSQNYLAAPVVAPAPVKLSPFQTQVQSKLTARGETIPADWQPYFDREARGDKKGKLLIAAKFLKGDGIQRDQNYAVELIRQAADAGEKEAMMWLGYANQSGNLGKPDLNAAMRWFEAAGKAGVHQGYMELGRIYETGVDGAPDMETALSWYGKAAQAGNVKAAEAINRINTAQQAASVPQASAPQAQPSLQPVADAQTQQPFAAPSYPAPSPAQQVQQLIQPVAQPAPSQQKEVFVPAPQAAATMGDDLYSPPSSSSLPATPVVASMPAQAPIPASQTGMSKQQATSDTKAIQRMLRVLGYKVDRIDGEYGPQTATAIRAYQRDHSVYPDGEPTPELIDALMRDVRGH